jgi:hypothetical protein
MWNICKIKFNMLIMCIAAILCSITVSFAEEQSFSPEMEIIIEGSMLGDMLVSSGIGTLIHNYTRMDTTYIINNQHFQNCIKAGNCIILDSYDRFKNIAFDHDKIFFEIKYEIPDILNELGEPQTIQTVYASNGERLDVFNIEGVGNKGIIQPRGTIYPASPNFINGFKTHNPGYNSMTIMGKPVHEFLLDRIEEKSKISILGEELIDGNVCQIIQSCVAGPDSCFTLWLDTELYYWPRRIEIQRADGKMTINSSFIKYNDDLWYLKERIVDDYYYEENAGNLIHVSRDTYRVANDFKLNTEIPVSLFEIDFPRGLEVYDYSLQEYIIVDDITEVESRINIQ